MGSLSVHPTYRRSQVEWALWRLIGGETDPPQPIPDTLRIRITRLLELDRDPDLGHASQVPHMRYAFVDGKPAGRGREIAYTVFNAFCLALALDFLDVGFKQSEVVFLIRHIRQNLATQVDQILENPPAPRERLSPDDRPDSPTFTWKDKEYADCRRYMVIERIELDSIAQGISVVEPTYCAGIEALSRRMNAMGLDFRKALVIELAEMAVRLCSLLEKAPEARRGRPPKLENSP